LTVVIMKLAEMLIDQYPDVLRRLGPCPTDDAARRAVERAPERR
jgi:hypothetical protein